jgi:hypothetical protein
MAFFGANHEHSHRTMKTHRICKLLVAALLSTFFIVSARAQAPENVIATIQLVRSAYNTEREAILADTLQLTESESEAFWPIYESYRVEAEKIGDGLVKLVLEYADLYADVPEDRAREMLKTMLALERKMVDNRASFLKRAGKKLPAVKVLRLAQLEQRLDLALRLQLAGAVPLVPEPSTQP